MDNGYKSILSTTHPARSSLDMYLFLNKEFGGYEKNQQQIECISRGRSVVQLGSHDSSEMKRCQND
jgi:hypothetical protein